MIRINEVRENTVKTETFFDCSAEEYIRMFVCKEMTHLETASFSMPHIVRATGGFDIQLESNCQLQVRTLAHFSALA